MEEPVTIGEWEGLSDHLVSRLTPNAEELAYCY